MSITDMMRKRFPERKDEIDAFQTCRKEGFVAGAIWFGAVGGTVLAATTVYSRRIDPLLHSYVIPLTLSSGCAAAAWGSYKTGQQCIENFRQYVIDKRQSPSEGVTAPNETRAASCSSAESSALPLEQTHTDTFWDQGQSKP
eukprot:m.45543 g.45543  ORF g.45543 m.45543 type:complete len:142 (+) comp10885_c0_seq2:296-721(+)